MRRQVSFILLLGAAGCVIEPQGPSGDVRVWEGTFTLPTYAEGPPDPNPPFEFFDPPRINYPYTIRDNLTGERGERGWKALFLENDYLRCTVLPELGGHLYSCTDKLNGEEVFYANPSIKLSKIGYRGAWAAFGVEFNYPVSHNWMSTSPVDFAYRRNGDGSGSVWVGNVDRVVGTQWTVELKLRPGRAALEQHTTLYNRSDFRHRFYWWTNAAVQVWDDSRVLYPMTHSASHGFRDIDTWPVDSRGTDNSVVGNHLYGPVSRFSHGSREPFMAVYHPRTGAGVVHYSSPLDLPAKKVWSFGGDERGLDWREALSDDGSAYVEIQAGLFRNQETYAFLEPGERVRFSETWVPVRGLGGVSRGNEEAVVHLGRTESGIVARFNVVDGLGPARALLLQGGDTLREVFVDASPEELIAIEAPRAMVGQGSVTAALETAAGDLVISHTEGEWDIDEDLQVGPVPQSEWPEPAERSEGDWIEAGLAAEREGRRLWARSTYLSGLERFPGSLSLTRAVGRLDVVLKRPDSAVGRLRRSTDRVSTDRESWYYLGHALLALGDSVGARSAWERSQTFGAFKDASRYYLAALHARGGRLTLARSLLSENVESVATRLRLMDAAVLRHLDRTAEASRVLAAAQSEDPTSSQARYEATLQGREDEGLWIHLAGDPERILAIAVEYARFGFLEDAVSLLSREYPAGGPVASEPGQPHPRDYPLVHYYRAYYEGLLGQDPGPSLSRAQSAPLRYVFPNRHETGPVLEAALSQDPEDTSARFLRGVWAMSGGQVDRALEDWDQVLSTRPDVPALHWAMGRAVLQTQGDVSRAAALFDAGVQVDPTNEGLYFALDEALGAMGATAAARANALMQHPDPSSMSPDLVYLTAQRLAQVERFDEAESLFVDRFFVREEGGTNPREVWLDVRLTRAEARAARGACGDVLAILGGLTDPSPGVSISDTGLADWLVRRQDLSDRMMNLERRCPSGR